MTIMKDVVLFLRTYVPVDSVLNDRVHPLQVPQGAALPAMSYQLISAVRVRSHNGFSHLVTSRVQFNIWSRKYSEVAELAEGLKTLDGFKGTMNGRRIDGIKVDESERDDYEPDTERYGRKVDLHISHYQD